MMLPPVVTTLDPFQDLAYLVDIPASSAKLSALPVGRSGIRAREQFGDMVQRLEHSRGRRSEPVRRRRQSGITRGAGCGIHRLEGASEPIDRVGDLPGVRLGTLLRRPLGGFEV